MQRGAYTALSYNVPIITSNWSLLRQNFCKGTVHIDNTSIGLEHGIKMICNDLEKYREEIAELNIKNTEIFNEKIKKINERLQSELDRGFYSPHYSRNT